LLCLIGRAGGDHTVAHNVAAPSARADHAAGGDTGRSGQGSQGEAE
jgi:hypothetical protein